jgi:hypothetical protein
LVEYWDGHTWSIESSSRAATARSSSLTDVSCGSNTACTAIGGYRNSAGKMLTLVERGEGGIWSTQVTPSLGGDAELTHVSCASARTCTVIGTDQQQILVERWDATGWSIQPTPAPAHAASAELTGLSCASAFTCTAVGSYNAGPRQRLTLAERWTGTRS